MLLRPNNIDHLSNVLMGLANYGGARVPEEWQTWLLDVGVARRADDSVWAWPTRHFLSDALPASSPLDMVRRVVIRDPLYRLHLDLCLISVIHAVAVAERWRRFEEILFDSCRPIAPRLMQLLEWQMARTGRRARELSDADWSRCRAAAVDRDADTFGVWDQQLWGECRSSAELFPLLLGLYLPLCQQPVHVVDDQPVDVADGDTRLVRLIGAAREGEGVLFPAAELDAIRILQNRGVPIRVWESDTAHFIASLAAPITVETQSTIVSSTHGTTPASVPLAARRSYLAPSNQGRLPTRLSALGGMVQTIAPFSLKADCTRWPMKSPDDAPSWLPLPGTDDLATAGMRRSESPAADQALRDLAEHPLYGLMLQLLVLEALDRELGEETVILAPPLNRKLESIEDWAETKVLYRPREDKTDNPSQPTNGFHMLGPLDEVLGQVAREVGIIQVASPLESGLHGPWSKALALMNTADLVVGKHDRWTMTPHILDRLHSGTLMKDIIRQGRGVRDKMHHVLLSLWQQQSEVNLTEAAPA